MIVAVVGSRKGAVLSDVTAFLFSLAQSEHHAVVVSGGAQGVDKTAEQEWLRLGGKVVSLRPINLAAPNGTPDWWVERWKLGDGTGYVETLRDCSFADFTSCAVYRDMLIAESCDKLVAFQSDPTSSGTSITVGFAKSAEKPVYVYTPRAPFASAS